MENIYIIIIVVLFILAASDLVVGVSNDAVNFLNSAVGAKAAPFAILMIIAGVGIVLGTTFSSGMMEVARKGIFHPQHFYFAEIMIIFTAVMVTDVILLDLFNTLGLPTSTTVSIVFELLGSAVAVSFIKIYSADQSISALGEYINTDQAMSIVIGIFLAVIIAFIVGAVVQYISRLIFTFNYRKNLKYAGAVFGGLAITAITYFILIKGAKGSSFLKPETVTWIKSNSLMILGFSFIGWTIVLQVITLVFKRFNVLRLIVLVGTFSLAFAFASNDLVNFIGVPLAGLKSYQEFSDSGSAPNELLMTALTDKVQTKTYLLLIAGVIMVITLWFSKKARSVVQTTLDLSRQNEGEERFGSTLLSRSLVRGTRNLGRALTFIIPKRVNKNLDNRFKPRKEEEQIPPKGAKTSFDMLRAAVNLVVASILIALGTSLQQPLSTTYVTFMVAMGASLSDRAWGRESAVYRITGVLTVIGGWFMTAIIAFTVAGIIAFLIHLGGLITIGVLILMAGFLIFKTQRIHSKRNKVKAEKTAAEEAVKSYSTDAIIEKSKTDLLRILFDIPYVYSKVLFGLQKENRRILKNSVKKVKKLNKETKLLKESVFRIVRKIREDALSTGHFYIQVLEYLRETALCLNDVAKPAYTHVDNHHTTFSKEDFRILGNIKYELKKLFILSIDIIKNSDFSKEKEFAAIQEQLIQDIDAARKEHVSGIKKGAVSPKASVLYLGLLHETKNILFSLDNLIKTQKEFQKS